MGFVVPPSTASGSERFKAPGQNVAQGCTQGRILSYAAGRLGPATVHYTVYTTDSAHETIGVHAIRTQAGQP